MVEIEIMSKRPIMGKIVNSFCDRIYLTDDNPRNENPKKIRLSIKKKINKAKLFEVADRSKAIKRAILDLNLGDVLIVAGKGHENTQDYGKHKKLFSDKNEILKNIKIKNKNLSSDIKINILNEIIRSNNISIKTKINKASINSKEIKKNDIFFAIKGKNKNGNLFAQEAFKRGASIAVVNSSKKKPKQIKVKDTLKFLTRVFYDIKRKYRKQNYSYYGKLWKNLSKRISGEDT